MATGEIGATGQDNGVAEHAGKGTLDIQVTQLAGSKGTLASNGALSVKGREVVVDDGLNLIDNGLSYGKAPLIVELTTEKSLVVISVTDQGQGIPKNQRDQALMPFQRLDAARGGSGHCGLGRPPAQSIQSPPPQDRTASTHQV